MQPSLQVAPQNKVLFDNAGAVRIGEELDVAAIDKWLKMQVPDLRGTPSVTQFSGGASNWTYCLAYSDRDLILRRPPNGTKAKSAHDMAREFNVQKRLKPAFHYVPEMIALCQEESVVGTTFYVMERLVGIIPRGREISGIDSSVAINRAICISAIDCLIELHRTDAKLIGLSDIGKGDNYARRQIEGWADRYRRAKTWNVPSFTKTIDWLAKNIPKDSAISLIHNDYRLDNLVLDPQNPSRIIGVLDWEMATLGDPLMDLGNMLAYWIEADDDRLGRSMARQPSFLPGMLTRQQIVDHYSAAMDSRIEDFRFYMVYGLFRLAGIVQQIYFRYYHRQTRNPSFRNFWILAHYIDHRCGRIIKTGKI